MKLTLERDALHTALQRVGKIVERRNTIPILAHLRLTAEGHRLTITGTDLDIEATTDVPAESAASGEACVPAHLFADIVAKLPAGAQILLEHDGAAKAVLKTGRSRFQMPALPVSDFPDQGPRNFTHHFEIKPDELSALLSKTEFAVSNEETRYYLNGIFLHCVQQGGQALIRAVATDGHRLAKMELPAPSGAENMPGVILPRKTIGEVRRLLKDASAPISIDLVAGSIRLTIASAKATTVLTSKLIDGTFPDYQRVIPTMNDKGAVFARKPFQEALDRVSCMSGDRARGTKFTFVEDLLVLSVDNKEGGEAADEIEGTYADAPLEIGFNAKYVADALSVLDGDSTLIKLADPGSPTLLMDREGAALQIVLMPCRV
jgi:DNA polymerase-3 subunit beta